MTRLIRPDHPNRTPLGTTFMNPDQFIAVIDGALPGASVVYATGDIGRAGGDLAHLKKLAMTRQDNRTCCLTQRPRHDLPGIGAGRSFDYIATKRAPPDRAPEPSRKRRMA